MKRDVTCQIKEDEMTKVCKNGLRILTENPKENIRFEDLAVDGEGNNKVDFNKINYTSIPP
jgi:hypothetical protein